MRTEQLVQFEANIDDIDPRLLPVAVERLLAAGALDAWVTPIVMKKGRPAFTVGALGRPDDAAAIRDALFRETTTIGVREFGVTRHALERHSRSVDVDGETIAVKVATDGDTVVNVSVEWDDVERAATVTGRPAKDVLAAAEDAARRPRPPG